MKAPRISSSLKKMRVPAVKGGSVPMPKIQQMRGKGQNVGGLPNDLKKLFPKSSSAKKPKF